MQNKIAELRTEYLKSSLDVKSVDADPFVQFEKWFGEALKAQVIEPNAMHLSTVNESGKPSSRIVLLKGMENKKFIFYTNYQSKKGKELDNNPACALTFFWPDLERQVRIEGIASRVEQTVSETYFQSRPRASQIGAWSSPQSSPIKNREILEQRFIEVEKRFENQPVLPKPHQWGGFGIEPFLFEFWQGRSSRLHDRIEYMFDGKWKINRLAP
ncbi:MAG TPA: pyridoxamine 5'-phosphate oxidase [Chryseosolibacter sp.]|nr:pyridoxamine 5'-phosphate oxidase [Chryseosolibacter sp.]